MNSVADAVISTRTSAPSVWSRRSSSTALYAAMEPVMPRAMRRPSKASDSSGHVVCSEMTWIDPAALPVQPTPVVARRGWLAVGERPQYAPDP